MHDLFDAPLLPGFAAIDDIVSAEEEEALIAGIDAAGLAPFRFQGWTGKRLTGSFGWHYDFDVARMEPVAPIPEWLLPLRARAAAFADLPEETLAQVLLTRYDPGAGIGWHRDRPVFDRVVGVSLGAPTTMRFRQRHAGGFRRAGAPLRPRSAYLLSGEVREAWEHSIAEMETTRWSVTFRSLRGR